MDMGKVGWTQKEGATGGDGEAISLDHSLKVADRCDFSASFAIFNGLF